MDISGSSPRPDVPGPELPGPDPRHPDAANLAPRSPNVDPPALPGAAEAGGGAQPGPTAPGRGQLVRLLVVYSLLRFALVAALTAVLTVFMPLIVALMFAIIIQLPLAWLVFARPRRRVNAALAQASADRRAERARLQAALTGHPDR